MGFDHGKKVNDGENYVLLSHIGKDPNSLHKKAIMQSRDLINQAQHILHIIEKQTSQQVANNRLILKTSIDVRCLTFQTCSLRGHNKHTASYNERVASVVLDNAPQNASYTSHSVQKEILHIFAKKIRCFIREEIGELKFCIIVNVARDESKREQMAIILRLWIKLDFQGYDGASNMRGEWSGLQALVSNKCPYVYYKNCSAHHLQLTLIVAYREAIPSENEPGVYSETQKTKFQQKPKTSLSTPNGRLVARVQDCKSPHGRVIDEPGRVRLQASQAAKIERLFSIDEFKTSKGLNQIGTLKRARDTRWSSHLSSFQ
ncbi:zinc finger MYM-type protein 1-like [Gossypium australe]|uniref:Zinc finger MYM-type protein 1-like n=1 Tax=Gossypium australe TaxID=47621 RepID=A0A5B6UHC8_9ROSI|nr:zinc finger MYM-type protein 1-like [Gossypium australe]